MTSDLIRSVSNIEYSNVASFCIIHIHSFTDKMLYYECVLIIEILNKLCILLNILRSDSINCMSVESENNFHSDMSNISENVQFHTMVYPANDTKVFVTIYCFDSFYIGI